MISESCKAEFKVVINRVSKTSMKTSKIKDLDEMIDTIAAPLLGVLAEDEWIMNTFGYNNDSKKASAQTEKAFEAMAKRIQGKYIPLVIKTI